MPNRGQTFHEHLYQHLVCLEDVTTGSILAADAYFTTIYAWVSGNRMACPGLEWSPGQEV